MFFLELGRINTQQLISSRILHLWGHLQFVENAKKSHLGKGGGFIWRKVKITQSLCLPALQVIRDQLLPVGKCSRADSSAPAKASLPGVLNHQDMSHWPSLLSALISDFLGNFLSRQTQIRLDELLPEPHCVTYLFFNTEVTPTWRKRIWKLLRIEKVQG